MIHEQSTGTTRRQWSERKKGRAEHHTGFHQYRFHRRGNDHDSGLDVLVGPSVERTGRRFLRCCPSVHHPRRYLRKVAGGQHTALKMALMRVCEFNHTMPSCGYWIFRLKLATGASEHSTAPAAAWAEDFRFRGKPTCQRPIAFISVIDVWLRPM